MNATLRQSIQSIPTGGWAVGVSGGADSVALLCLLKGRSDLQLRVVHLDHQTRGGASTEDAQFVRQLARKLLLPLDLAKLAEIEATMPGKLANRSARFRAARLAWFKNVVAQHQLQGVILAHQADDQAETVMLRLLRGSGFRGLAGIARRSVVGGLVILRPMLNVRRETLVQYLKPIGQDWREDASNESADYARNRVRKLLRNSPKLTGTLIDLGESCRDLRRWTRCAPQLEERFAIERLANLPNILARESARRWLIASGSPAVKLSPAVLDRLITMAGDAASPPRVHFPGGLTVRRRGGIIFVE